MDLGLTLLLLLVSAAAGFLGAMLGLGGGIVIVPALTLLFGRDIHEAIGASIVSVIATSTSAAIVYIREGYVDIRLGLLLGLATVVGAPIGGFLGVWMSPRPLETLFGVMLLYTAYSMARAGNIEPSSQEHPEDDPDAVRFVDKASGRTHCYRPRAVGVGACTSLGAGFMSGMLGIGGGFINVPVMHLIMGVPIKAAIATSNYMIGITGAASAMIYHSRGFVKPLIVAPCAIGVLVGAQIGSRVASKVHSEVLRWAFVVLIIVISAQMFRKGIGAG